jgi:hypothetical protein
MSLTIALAAICALLTWIRLRRTGRAPATAEQMTVAQGAGGTGMDAQLGVARQPGVRCSLYARAGTGAGHGCHAQASVASYGYDR